LRVSSGLRLFLQYLFMRRILPRDVSTAIPQYRNTAIPQYRRSDWRAMPRCLWEVDHGRARGSSAHSNCPTARAGRAARTQSDFTSSGTAANKSASSP
jgi:hypothetical protein